MKDRKQSLKYSAIAVIIFSLLAHGYRFSNNLYSHDSLLMIYQNDCAWQIALGRIVQPLLIFFRGTICNPWLISMTFIAWMILSVFLIVDLLGLKDVLQIVLVAGIMVCNVIFTASNASYLPWVDFYAMACTLAILGVWCYAKAFDDAAVSRKKKYLWLVLGTISMSISLGIYQSYICVSIGLMMMLLIKDLACNMRWKQFFNKVLCAICSLFVAALIYYIEWKIFQKAFNIWTSDSYNGLAGVGDYSDTSIFGLLKETYRQVKIFLWNPEIFTTLFFRQKSLSFVWVYALRAINIIVIIFSICSLIIVNNRNMTALWQKALQAVIIILFPLGINFVCFISKGMEHTLMIYGFILIYIEAIYMRSILTSSLKETSEKALYKRIAFSIPFVVVIWVNIVYANQVYLKKQLISEASTSMMSRVVADIEDVEGYVPGVTPVAFYGNFQTSEYVKELSGFEEIMPYGMGKSSVTYYGADYALLSYILNVNMNLTRVDTSDEIVMEAVKAMPCYPSSDSIVYYNGTIIVKIAEY